MSKDLPRNPYMENKPLSLEEMQAEIAWSRVKGPPSSEFSKEAISGVLKELNLRSNDVTRTEQR